MDNYEKIAEGVVVNRIRSSWIELYKLYNDQAAEKGVSLSMAFVLLTINENFGTPVTKIAPRMSMEPNSLSRILKAMEKKGLFIKEKIRLINEKYTYALQTTVWSLGIWLHNDYFHLKKQFMKM